MARRRTHMKTLRAHGRFRLAMLALMVVLCVAIGILGTQQRAEGWSAGPEFGFEMPAGGAHGMMAEDAIIDFNNLLPAGYLSDIDKQLLRDGASTPDSIWGVGVDMKYPYWEQGAWHLQELIGRDIVTCDYDPTDYWWLATCSCIDEPCFTLKDDWENDNAHLMNHESALWSEWNPIKYWADKARQDLNNNNRSRAMVHAGYAMHFAQDYLNPPHLGSLPQEVAWSWDLELDWEINDHKYVPKAWVADYFQLAGRCVTSGIEKDLLSYRYITANAWLTLPDLAWIEDQGEWDVPLDKKITEAVMWSEQVSLEVLQYVFGVEPRGGCNSETVQKIFIGYYQRPAAPAGLDYWSNRLSDTGGNQYEIIEFFADSQEAKGLYAPIIDSSNISDVVTKIYWALFNRAPAQGGLNYYVNGFNSGWFTPATIMLNVLDGATGKDLQSVNNKVTTSNLFTWTIDSLYHYSGDTDAQKARTFLSTVGWDPESIPTQAEVTLFIENDVD